MSLVLIELRAVTMHQVPKNIFQRQQLTYTFLTHEIFSAPNSMQQSLRCSGYGPDFSEIPQVTPTRPKPTTTQFENKHSTIQPYCTQPCGHMASLAKWLRLPLQTKWLWVRILLLSLKLHISHLFQVRSSLTLRQLQSVDSL